MILMTIVTEQSYVVLSYSSIKVRSVSLDYELVLVYRTLHAAAVLSSVCGVYTIYLEPVQHNSED